jgi:RimJ/RimL family protein N-acetyltransferase
VIAGERIRLRPLERDDLSRSVAWLADPEVRDGIAMFMPLSLEDETKWFEDMKKRERALQILAVDARPPGAPAGALAQDWLHIGSTGFNELDWRVRAAELGIMIGDKKFWSQGYGADTVRTLVNFGFKELNLNRIYLRVFDFNRRAIRCYTKVGFVEEGRLRQGHYHDGRYHDLLIMGLLRAEWTPG